MNNTPAQSLANVDIFEIMNLQDSEGQKEMLAKELTETIWQLVMEPLIEEHVTPEDEEQMMTILENQDLSSVQIQEQLSALLKPKFPDLDDRLAEAAEQMKRDTLQARIDGLLVYHRENLGSLATVKHAEAAFAQARYVDAMRMLNGMDAATV